MRGNREPVITHYTDADAPSLRLVRALCGRLVNEEAGETSPDPSCGRCREILAERESEPLPSWAKEAIR